MLPGQTWQLGTPWGRKILCELQALLMREEGADIPTLLQVSEDPIRTPTSFHCLLTPSHSRMGPFLSCRAGTMARDKCFSCPEYSPVISGVSGKLPHLCGRIPSFLERRVGMDRTEVGCHVLERWDQHHPGKYRAPGKVSHTHKPLSSCPPRITADADFKTQ